jgi:hypothetical protein
MSALVTLFAETSVRCYRLPADQNAKSLAANDKAKTQHMR